jgi:ribose 5-phosphate isomerase B
MARIPTSKEGDNSMPIFSKVYIGADHAGYALKQFLLDHFYENHIVVEDCGAYDESPSNYADIGHNVALKVQADKGSGGILICGSGIGISIAANRHQDIRAALCHDTCTAKLARAHNDANIIVLGSRALDASLAKECVEVFLNTPFEGGRHIDRVNHIDGVI